MNDLLKLRTPDKLLNYMKENISYGFMTKDGSIEKENYVNFGRKYKLQTPEEVYKNKVGVCWDQVEFQKLIFDKYIRLPVDTYFVDISDGKKTTHTHTFLVYSNGDGYFNYFENSYEKLRGIHKFKNIYLTVNYVLENLKKDVTAKHITVYKYTDVRFGISADEYLSHVKKGDIVLKI